MGRGIALEMPSARYSLRSRDKKQAAGGAITAAIPSKKRKAAGRSKSSSRKKASLGDDAPPPYVRNARKEEEKEEEEKEEEEEEVHTSSITLKRISRTLGGLPRDQQDDSESFEEDDEDEEDEEDDEDEGFVTYSPKAGVMSAYYPKYHFDREEWVRMVGKPQEGTRIEYEILKKNTSRYKPTNPRHAAPSGGFSHSATRCKIIKVTH